MDRFGLIVAVFGLAVTGCRPVTVQRLKISNVEQGRATRLVDANEKMKGIRFNRPRPYLLVTKDVKKDVSTGSTETACKGEILYLPDFDEEYMIDVDPGLLQLNASFKFTNGWMLTEYNSNSDPQIDETVKAAGEAAAPFVPAASTTEGGSAIAEIVTAILTQSGLDSEEAVAKAMAATALPSAESCGEGLYSIASHDGEVVVARVWTPTDQ